MGCHVWDFPCLEVTASVIIDSNGHTTYWHEIIDHADISLFPPITAPRIPCDIELYVAPTSIVPYPTMTRSKLALHRPVKTPNDSTESLDHTSRSLHSPVGERRWWAGRCHCRRTRSQSRRCLTTWCMLDSCHCCYPCMEPPERSLRGSPCLHKIIDARTGEWGRCRWSWWRSL
jgi:hypothetical protein